MGQRVNSHFVFVVVCFSVYFFNFYYCFSFFFVRWSKSTKKTELSVNIQSLILVLKNFQYSQEKLPDSRMVTAISIIQYRRHGRRVPKGKILNLAQFKLLSDRGWEFSQGEHRGETLHGKLTRCCARRLSVLRCFPTLSDWLARAYKETDYAR